MRTLTPAAPLADDDFEALARKRAGARMGWYVHAALYLLVNMALAAISLGTGHHWAIFPALGGGLGLAMHGVGVWLSLGGGGLHERLLARERERLAAQRDPW